MLLSFLYKKYYALQFVLKHDKFRGLREVENFPGSICPSNSESLPLVQNILEQVIKMHPNITMLHIGADEVSCEDLLTMDDLIHSNSFEIGVAPWSLQYVPGKNGNPRRECQRQNLPRSCSQSFAMAQGEVPLRAAINVG
jgi:Glycosyl hydrolase family 20, catalytic domain